MYFNLYHLKRRKYNISIPNRHASYLWVNPGQAVLHWPNYLSLNFNANISTVLITVQDRLAIISHIGKELIEQHLETRSNTGLKLKTILEEGGLITDDMVMELIREKVDSPEVAQRGYLLDGFPNTSCANVNIVEQFAMLKSFKLAPDFLIYLKVTLKY